MSLALLSMTLLPVSETRFFQVLVLHKPVLHLPALSWTNFGVDNCRPR